MQSLFFIALQTYCSNVNEIFILENVLYLFLCIDKSKLSKAANLKNKETTHMSSV